VSTLTSGSSSPWYLGQDTLDGIVYYIYKGSDGMDHGLIVAKTDSTALWRWQDSTYLVNANRSWDGVYNMGLMSDSPGAMNYSPAKDWITSNFSSEWYLPSIDELSLLWHNRFHINQALSAGGLPLLSQTADYWSSTEISAAYSWFFLFNAGIASVVNKTSPSRVRAIRAF
jgi:hypothetical protein